MYNGIINIHKEAGFTSHDVVAKMRGILRQKKIGHTGTLDPQATGVLPVCLGSGTKLCDMLTDRDKEYVAELLLGVTTDTQDTTGQVLSECSVTCGEAQVRQAAESFVGAYDQVPPMYSALKVDGKKLYELARAGKEVERSARRVEIKELEILDIQLPVVKMRVVCSKGTYIRTLCADIGEKLGCGGTMQRLVRTRVGGFGLEDAITLAQLEQLRDANRVGEVVLAVDAVFAECPALHVQEAFERLLDNGNAIETGQTAEQVQYAEGEFVRFYRADGSFAGVYAYRQEKQRYQPVKMFLER
ncbi:MAG: tRNA pseudouridine(55) synthase TruB [Lachnospiraceae bacterium]|nr:tRNA pseudouridine(55) synthase TruB [Lachnospiraceae bacterium]